MMLSERNKIPFISFYASRYSYNIFNEFHALFYRLEVLNFDKYFVEIEEERYGSQHANIMRFSKAYI